jgi:fission process protein 1
MSSPPISESGEVHPNDEPVDILRDTYWRYLGYTNELGESLRPLVPRAFVNATYGVAGMYVLADTVTKSVP